MVGAPTRGGIHRLDIPDYATEWNLSASSSGTQAGGTKIDRAIALFTTVAGAGFSGRLADAQLGRIIKVINAGANALAVFPSFGQLIYGLGLNAPFSLAGSGGVAEFICASIGVWYPFQGGGGSTPTGPFTLLESGADQLLESGGNEELET